MSFERTSAVLLLNLPPSSLAGIDLLSFTITPRFRGVKDVPGGFHFVFTGASNAFSVRHGLWFQSNIKAGPSLFISKWVPATDALVAEQDPAEHLRWRANIGEFWREGLTPYRQSAIDGETKDDDWPSLTSFITASLLSRITRGDSTHWSLTSASSMMSDRDVIPGINAEDFDTAGSEELQLLPIDLKKTWRDGATGRERTEAAMDRSWALQHLIQEHADNQSDNVIGELQFCFIMTLTLNNWSCFEGWKRLLNLVFTSAAAVNTIPDFFVRFVAAVRLQLLHIKDAEGGLIDMADEGGSLLKSLLVRFRKGIIQGQSLDSQDVIDELDDLEAFLREEYGWQFGGSYARNGTLDLEDGEQVQMDTTDYDEDDETGEFAPQVVALSAEQAEMLSGGEHINLVSQLKQSKLHESSTTTSADSSASNTSEDEGYNEDSEEELEDVEDMDQRF